MANYVSKDYIIRIAIAILKRDRCGFDNCEAIIDYIPMTDQYMFVAQGSFLYLRYNLGYEPRYDKFLLDLVVDRWIDPIC